jgi:hypothetical protein
MAGKDRAVIAQTMSALLGRTVTSSMLADFTRNGNGERQVRFPAGWIGPFCEATDNYDLARYFLPESDRRILTASADLTDLRKTLDRAQETLKRLRGNLGAIAKAKRGKSKGAK